jgi:hypothetical protein
MSRRKDEGLKWGLIDFSKRELDEIRSQAKELLVDRSIEPAQAWTEAVIAALNRKGFLKITPDY